MHSKTTTFTTFCNNSREIILPVARHALDFWIANGRIMIKLVFHYSIRIEELALWQ